VAHSDKTTPKENTSPLRDGSVTKLDNEDLGRVACHNSPVTMMRLLLRAGNTGVRLVEHGRGSHPLRLGLAKFGQIGDRPVSRQRSVYATTDHALLNGETPGPSNAMPFKSNRPHNGQPLAVGCRRGIHQFEYQNGLRQVFRIGPRATVVVADEIDSVHADVFGYIPMLAMTKASLINRAKNGLVRRQSPFRPPPQRLR
jgi:hypothetical protein